MPLQLPKNLGNLWRTQNSNAPKVAHEGSIISFHYTCQRNGRIIHDPYPLVLVARSNPQFYRNVIRGINLNYLTVPYIKGMINRFLEKPFNYKMVENDNYIVGAFRTYKYSGISQLRMMDSNFLRGVAELSRTMDVNELDQIRAQIENIMRYQINQPAAEPGEIQTPLT